MDIGNNKELDRAKNKRRLIVFFNDYSGMISFVLAALILAAGLFYYIYPKYQVIMQEMESTAEAQKNEIDALDSYLDKLNDYLADYLSIGKKEKEKLDVALPDGQFEKEELFAYMEDFLDGRGLMVQSISLKTEKASERNSRRPVAQTNQEGEGDGLSSRVQEVVIDIKIVGLDYDGLKRLLEDIENNLRLLDVRNLNFRQESKEASFSIATYYFLTGQNYEE